MQLLGQRFSSQTNFFSKLVPVDRFGLWRIDHLANGCVSYGILKKQCSLTDSLSFEGRKIAPTFGVQLIFNIRNTPRAHHDMRPQQKLLYKRVKRVIRKTHVLYSNTPSKLIQQCTIPPSRTTLLYIDSSLHKLPYSESLLYITILQLGNLSEAQPTAPIPFCWYQVFVIAITWLWRMLAAWSSCVEDASTGQSCSSFQTGFQW